MKQLKRTSVDKFNIENAVKLENLSENDIIPMENFCKSNYKKVELDNNKIKHFLNGVMITVKIDDGIYMVYNNEKFIGLGIVKNQLIKRDIIL